MSDETQEVEQLSQADLKGMSHTEIHEARKGGRLRDLLDGTAASEGEAFTPSDDAPGGGHTYASIGAWLRSLSPAEVRIARNHGHIPGVTPPPAKARRYRDVRMDPDHLPGDRYHDL